MNGCCSLVKREVNERSCKKILLVVITRWLVADVKEDRDILFHWLRMSDRFVKVALIPSFRAVQLHLWIVTWNVKTWDILYTTMTFRYDTKKNSHVIQREQWSRSTHRRDQWGGSCRPMDGHSVSIVQHRAVTTRGRNSTLLSDVRLQCTGRPILKTDWTFRLPHYISDGTSSCTS